MRRIPILMKIGAKSANDFRVTIGIQFGLKYDFYWQTLSTLENSLFLPIETTNTENNQTVNNVLRLSINSG